MKNNSTFQRIITILVIISQLIAFIPLPVGEAAGGIAALADNTVLPSASTAPTVLDQPVSLSRVQSSYVAGQTVVDFTLTNNLPTTRVPEIPETATITDTVEILAAYPPTDDVNTLRSLTLADTLAAGVTLLAASGNPVQTGSTLTWTLPDLVPQASTTVSFTLQTLVQSTSFTNLDTGAQASAKQWGNPVNTSAPPAVLIPNSVDASFTLSTPDAVTHEADMLWVSAELGQDALAMFAYVQDLPYEPYKGSLRGTRGTLWGQAGNSADQSSLLIAMLRAAGIPARYRHGTLNPADAQILIATMFPVQAGGAGSIPAGTPISDPVNDPDLLALVSDHWWVEAYLPGSGWTNLDPSFASAQPGDVFATPGTNDRIAELPTTLRHKITFKLDIEQFNEFPINGTGLTHEYPVNISFTTVELAGSPLTFGHLVETEVQGGIVTNVIHTYTPYFTIEGTDEFTFGETYQDLLSNFAFGTSFTTGAWLTVETEDPDGHVESFTRELKDLIGQDVRLNGGGLNLSPPDNNAALFGLADVLVMWFLPQPALDNALTTHYREGLFARTLDFAASVEASIGLFELTSPTPEELALISEATLDYQLNQSRFMAQTGLDFARTADQTIRNLETGLGVRMIYDQPRIIALATEYNATTGEVKNTLDLRSTRATTYVVPGQAVAAAQTANWLKGVSESYQEGTALGEFTGIEPVTTARVFEAMHDQGIEPLLLTPATMTLLDVYGLPAADVAYAKAALLEGKNVLIPSAPVLIDGDPTLAWWEIDPATGETIGVGEGGLHTAAIEWVAIEIGFGFPFLINDVLGYVKSVREIWEYVACHVIPALGGTTSLSGDSCTLENPFGLPWPMPGSCNICGLIAGPAGDQPAQWMDMPAHQCPVDNCGVERFVLDANRVTPIPLAEMTYAYPNEFIPQTRMGATNPVTDNGSAGSPMLDLSTSPGSSALQPEGSATFNVVPIVRRSTGRCPDRLSILSIFNLQRFTSALTAAPTSPLK